MRAKLLAEKEDPEVPIEDEEEREPGCFKTEEEFPYGVRVDVIS